MSPTPSSRAKGGPVAEGSVGGGTGMICYEFKGGTGTASRVVPAKPRARPGHSYTIGVLVQANCGRRPQLTIAGVPVGKEIPGSVYTKESGSIIIVVATDAPLLPDQLKRLARRAPRPGPHRKCFGQWFRRFVHRLLDRQPRRGRSGQADPLGADRA